MIGLKFIDVSLELPNDIVSLFEKITQFQQNTILAGGYLSDLYIGNYPKDIDFFIKYNAKSYREILNLFSIDINYKYSNPENEHYFDSRIIDIQNVSYNGQDIQLIFTNEGRNVIKKFDFRFREFFYDGTSVKATPEALGDIEKKQFVFGITDNPLGSFLRLMRFEKKYDFVIEPTSFERLKGFFNQRGYSLNEVKDKTPKWMNETTSGKVLSSILTDVIPRFEIDPSLLRMDKVIYAKRHDLTRDIVDKIFNKVDFSKGAFTHVFKSDYYRDLTEKIKMEIVSEFKKQRVRFIHLIEPSVMNKLLYALDYMSEGDIRSIKQLLRKSFTYDQQDILHPIIQKIQEYERVISNYHYFEPEIQVEFSDDVFLHPDIPYDAYLNNEIIKCRINLGDDSDHSNLIFNKDTKEILFSHYDEFSSIVFSELVFDHLGEAKKLSKEDIFKEALKFCQKKSTEEAIFDLIDFI